MSQPPAKHPYLRPKDAASLIVYRKDADGLHLLMGRRSRRHVFYPGVYVFPGGRIERGDFRAPAADTLHPAVLEKLMASASRTDAARARALAMAAIRETFEETGILIGRAADSPSPSHSPVWRQFLAHKVVPTLEPLRLIARAITPPGRSRRFDARFFAVSAQHCAKQAEPLDLELEEPAWVRFEATADIDLPDVTRLILGHFEAALREDPDLAPQTPGYFRRLESGHTIITSI